MSYHIKMTIKYDLIIRQRFEWVQLRRNQKVKNQANYMEEKKMKPLDIFASSLGHWYNLHLHATLTAENWHYDTPQIIRKPSKQD